MIKKFIRGNKERGAEVIKALEDLGGVNRYTLDGTDSDSCYFINNSNHIVAWSENFEATDMIQECFEELVLEDKKVITNKQFAIWYFDYLANDNVVQYKFNDEDTIRSRMYDYINDNNPTPVAKIRINFGEWILIERVDID